MIPAVKEFPVLQKTGWSRELYLRQPGKGAVWEGDSELRLDGVSVQQERRVRGAGRPSQTQRTREEEKGR